MIIDDMDGDPLEITVREYVPGMGPSLLQSQIVPLPEDNLIIEIEIGNNARWFSIERARYLMKVLGEKINQAANAKQADPR